MKSTQAWVWLTAWVLALGLNGIYHDGGAAWAHRAVNGVVARVAEQAQPMLALASERADWFTAKANVVVPNETASCRLATAVARLQAKLARTEGGIARFEAMSAREEAAMARMEADRARVEAQVERVRFNPAAFNPVVCPRIKVNVSRE